MQCELISWKEVQRLCQQLARQLKASGYRPDNVVAIGRGCMVPARLVCDYLDITALTSIKIEHYLTGSTRQAQAVIRYPLCTDIRDQRLLLMGDVNDSGDIHPHQEWMKRRVLTLLIEEVGNKHVH